MGQRPSAVVLAIVDASYVEQQSRARVIRATVLAVLVLLVILLVVRSSKHHGGGNRSNYQSHNMRALAHRLAQRGWTLYMMEGCGFCTKQMNELGEYPRHMVLSADASHRIISGDTSLIELDTRQIPAFPFWYRQDGQNRDSRTGYQDMAALEAMAA